MIHERMTANTYTETRSGLAPGLESPDSARRNLRPAALYEAAIRTGEGQIARGGPFCANTTPHTGRSPNDKFVVREPNTQADIWWGGVNQPLTPEHWGALQADVVAYLGDQQLYVMDVFAGADPVRRVPVRFVTTSAWSAIFVHNMFIRPQPEDLANFEP
ncbi:MAG: phosphoenolpyruvate carboxykinase (ATP), partial [Gemmatimonadales bacterium]